jgi:hypothetical protein
MSSAHWKVCGSEGEGIFSCDGEGISCDDCGESGDKALVRGEDALAFLVGGLVALLLAFRLSERLLRSGSSHSDW